MQPQVLDYQPRRSPDGGAVAKVIGVLLALPALVLTVTTLVIPTFATIGTSTTSESMLRGEAESVGFDNFDRLFADERFWPSVGFALSLVLLPILVALVAGPLVAAAVDWAGSWARWLMRAALSAAIVVFSPVALAIAWRRALADEPALLGDPDLAGSTLRTSFAFMTFGVVCAAAVMVFLPAFRARRRLWPTLFTIAGVALTGLLAMGLQQFTVPYLMTGFGPGNETTTPVGLMFTAAFQHGEIGYAAAAATVLLVLLAVLGLAAVLVVVLTRLRVSVRPLRSPRESRPVNAGAIVVALLALAAVVAVAVLTMGPWFDALGGQAPELADGAEDRTWSPAMRGALVSVGVAYLAALGISGLRPLGRYSEWLLMLFAPWLFVGVAPLAVELFRSARDEGGVNTEDVLMPQILVAVLPLLIMAVLCRGQAERWQQGVATVGGFFRTVVLPTLPLAGFLFVVTVFVNGQDLFWSMLVALEPDTWTVPLSLVSLQNSFATGEFSVAATTPLVTVLLGFLAVVAFQLLHLDRMTATVGRPDDPTGPIRVPVG